MKNANKNNNIDKNRKLRRYIATHDYIVARLKELRVYADKAATTGDVPVDYVAAINDCINTIQNKKG